MMLTTGLTTPPQHKCHFRAPAESSAALSPQQQPYGQHGRMQGTPNPKAAVGGPRKWGPSLWESIKRCAEGSTHPRDCISQAQEYLNHPTASTAWVWGCLSLCLHPIQPQRA